MSQDLAERDQADLIRLKAAAERQGARLPWLIAAISSLTVGLAVSLTLFKQRQDAMLIATEEATRSAAIGEFLHRDVLGSEDIVTLSSTYKPATLLDVLRKASVEANRRFADQPRTAATCGIGADVHCI